MLNDESRDTDDSISITRMSASLQSLIDSLKVPACILSEEGDMLASCRSLVINDFPHSSNDHEKQSLMCAIPSEILDKVIQSGELSLPLKALLSESHLALIHTFDDNDYDWLFFA